ncbi:serine hydrolase [Streptosporangium sp. NPDC001681]|uniref:serine hydrolase n=1 Tax=Streptosporangium sp. NPDC001681 TaxID=3154395 RepID=UPI00331F6F68
MFAYASFGKLVLGTYTLHLIENGLLALDKPISTYLGNDAPGSNVVTLRMLLAMTTQALAANDTYGMATYRTEVSQRVWQRSRRG